MYRRPGVPRRKKPLPLNFIRMIVATITIGLVVLIASVVGFKVHAPSSHHNKTNPTKLPNVSIAGSIPCQLSSKDKNDACAKAKAYAKATLTARGQVGQWGCLDTLWTHESDWDAWSVNKKFSDPDLQAYGIPQFIPKYLGRPYAVGEWQKQVDAGLSYISRRYKTPCAAWTFWQHPTSPPYDQNWY